MGRTFDKLAPSFLTKEYFQNLKKRKIFIKKHAVQGSLVLKGKWSEEAFEIS